MPVPSDYRELATGTLDPRGIEALWFFQASSAGQHLVLPDGRIDLIITYRLLEKSRVEGPRLAIVGPSTRPSLIAVNADDRFLGLRFRAGWGGICLNVDAAALADAALHGSDAERALGRDTDRLLSESTVEGLRSALVAVGRKRVADAHLRRGATTDRAVDLMHLTGGRLRLPDLARAVGVPERTLRRSIGGSVGLSFKALASVLRFQRTVRLLAGPEGSGLTLTQAAYEGGYSDQAHMTRAFRRHGGFTPGRMPTVALGSLPLPGLAESFKTDPVAPG